MPLSSTLLPALLGLGTGLALIVAIGTQNAYLLRLGIEGRNHVIAPAVLICAVSDALLILAGVLGVGAVIQQFPAAVMLVRVLGAGFLIVYGILAVFRAVKPKALVAAAGPPGTEPGRAGLRPYIGARVAIATIAAFTWLNPHVYLDTVVFLGSVANQQGTDERWWWAGGAIAASFIWFFALGFGSRLLRPFFARPTSWRWLDAFIAVVMLALGIRMAIG